MVYQIKLKNLFLVLIFGLVSFLFYAGIILNLNPVQNDLILVLMFLLILTFSLVMLLVEVAKKSYSIVMLHWFFCFIFYGVAAFIQYSSNTFLYAFNLETTDLIYITFAVFLWMLFYYIGTKIKFSRKINKSKFLSSKVNFNYAFIVFSTIMSILITLYVISQTGLNAIFSRSTASSAFQQESLAEQQMLTSLLRNSVLYGLAISILFYKKFKQGLFLVIIQLVACLIVNTPFGLARFNVAVVYIGLILLMFSSFKKNRLFIFVFFLAFIIVFPLINVFRRYSLFDIPDGVVFQTISDISDNFLTGHYDSFTMIIYSYIYTNEYGISFGYQLLGPLLFFIPRSIWPSKPIGSGAYILEAYGHSFTNGSAPLIAEGIINFGIFGVIILALFFGKISAYLDKVYWENVKFEHSTILAVFYPFSLSLFFFMNRGDLQNTFAFFVSHLSIFLIIIWINNQFAKVFKNRY
ncbi:oligosaccharide repeat unit polymerase [Mesobacillus persicus]|uniref:Oligosaccharide repeat unit polymerase n=1 Tax=Mesobacillus persicus TaxID=930146 RepID=A0A1H8GZS2_9BACI|nr:O-antigen polymerase [Mesobacillus persicus]SEN48718.1 oligosaccharide repeat unit polymerase [Mesobacillus persicus]